MRRSAVRSPRQPTARSWRFPASAGCTTVTNAPSPNYPRHRQRYRQRPRTKRFATTRTQLSCHSNRCKPDPTTLGPKSNPRSPAVRVGFESARDTPDGVFSSDRTMRFTGTTELRVENGKIAEEIGLDDGVTALTRLGLLRAV